MKRRNIILAALVVIAILTCAFFMQDGGEDTQIIEKTSAVEQEGMWKDAEYLKDTELGTGEKTLYVEVCAEGQAIEFTIHTDKETVEKPFRSINLLREKKDPMGYM